MSLQAWLIVRERVLADPGLQAVLWPLEAPAFRERLIGLGAPPEGVWPWDPGPLVLPVAPLHSTPLSGAPAGPGWIPVQLDLFSEPPTLVWRQTGGQPPKAGLHPSDVHAWSRRPLNRFLDVRTPIEVLDEPAPGPGPAGIVFHMSRCGSTLVSRMLAQIEGAVSLSEPRILGDLLRLGRFAPDLDQARQAGWLRSAVALTGAAGEKFVIKAEAGGLFHLPLLRRAFPDTPWLFLHRDPLDVMLSQSLQRSSEMIPIMIEAALPATPEEAPGIDLDEHCARTLAALCDLAADALAAGDGMAVAYDELPGAIEARIAPLFGLKPTAEDLDRMAAVATRDARRGEAAFADDQAQRRATADPRMTELADLVARPAWRRLLATAQMTNR